MGLTTYIKALKTKNLYPQSVQAATWKNWTLVSCFSGASTHFISESVSMGIDRNPEVAFFKALTEFCEKKLSRESQDAAIDLTERSDGFAAFPILEKDFDLAKQRAQENALNEAVERYLWAKWWDDPQISFQVRNLLTPNPGRELQDAKNLVSEFDLIALREIQMSETTGKYKLSILLAETSTGGFVTGGACTQTTADQAESRYSRAFGELLRHLIVLKKMKINPRKDLSFYEKRLCGFGFGEWRQAVVNRLNPTEQVQNLTETIASLPPLILDREIQHTAQDVVKIHRCLFENQPIFMGGRLERLCI